MIFPIIVLLIPIISAVAQAPHESSIDSTGTVAIHVTGFRNDSGLARIALYRGEKGFPNDSDKASWKKACTIDRDEVRIHVDGVEYGTYAVSVYHDANNNGTLDRKWRIIPAEGFGSSNNIREEKRKPSFQESSFTVGTDSTYITIEIEYLFDE